MKSEFALALNQIVSERNLPREMISQVLAQALTATYKKNNPNLLTSQNAEVKMDVEKGEIQVLVEKEIVEEVLDARTEVSLEDAQKQDPNAQLGDIIMADVTEKEFPKIAAQNAKQQIVQKLREAERDFQFNSFAEQEGAIVTGIIQSMSASGVVVGLGKVEGILSRKESLPNEKFELQQKIRAYVSEVKKSTRGMQIILSRTHRGMLRRLLEIEVPEVESGKVEIRAISREPGSRSKVAVLATEANLDAVGACIGQRGTRIQNIVNELCNEKIDVIEYSDDAGQFITKALGPAKVLVVFPNTVSVERPTSALVDRGDRESRTATVVVGDDQLSLAIGREGQNARLAAKLTGWRIDIKSGSEAVSEAVAKVNESPALKEHVGAATVSQLPQLRELLVRTRAMSSALSSDEFALAKRLLESVHEFEQKHGVIKITVAAPTAKPAPEPVPVTEPVRTRSGPEVPEAAFNMPIEMLRLSPKIEQHIVAAGMRSVGQLMDTRYHGDEAMLAIEGIGTKSLGEIKNALDRALEQITAPPPVPAPKPESSKAAHKPETDKAVDEPKAEKAEKTAAVIEEPMIKPLAEGEADVDFEKFDEYSAEGDEDDADRDMASIRRSGGAPKKTKVKSKDRKGRALIFDEDSGRTVVNRRGDEPAATT